MDQEHAAAKFLGVASRCLRTGQNLKALQISGAFAQAPISRQKHARLFEAIAQSRLGLTAEAKNSFKELFLSCEEDTVFKADVIREWAKLRIALGEMDNVSDQLELAYGIYTYQGLEERVGAILYLQSLVAMRQGDLQEAIDKTSWATAVSEIRLPDVAPFAPEIEPSIIEETATLTRTELAGITS